MDKNLEWQLNYAPKWSHERLIASYQRIGKASIALETANDEYLEAIAEKVELLRQIREEK